MIELLKGRNNSHPAIVDSRNSSTLSYRELRTKVAAAAGELHRYAGRQLALHLCTNTVDSIVLYLACLEAALPICLLEGNPATSPDRVIAAYKPELMFVPAAMSPPGAAISHHPFPGTEYQICRFEPNQLPLAVHPDLALLLTTSGSTGTPKLVRLSRRNILANARSIAAYLNLTPDERSIQGLPMHYSYGLSLINSHLVAGGTIVLTPHSFYTSDFWRDFDSANCTSFAGVPYMYEALTRLQFAPEAHPTLRTMTQAGGGLRPDLIRVIHRQTFHSGIRFFVMYGQTEATARISYVPPEQLEQKIGSIGIAIPGGRMETERIADFDSGELIYFGPNVMMGYAESTASLALGDELNGVLRTGDLVQRDSDGYFYLTGRLRRVAKLFGRRISLAEVESDIETSFPVRAAVIQRKDQLMVFLEADGLVNPAVVSGHIARRLSLPPKFVQVAEVGALPITANGKKDYNALSV